MAAAGMILVVFGLSSAWGGAELRVYPTSLTFSSIQNRQRIVVSQTDEQHVTRDVTEQALIQPKTESPLVEVQQGVVRPLAVGESTLVVSFADQSVEVPIKVKSIDPPGPVNFKLDVVPVFTKSGCNSGACHGASRGQDGFRLSLFGFDPDGDYFRVTREQSTRRINLGLPDKCLLIEKPTGQVAHTGGRRIHVGDANYQTLLRWLEEGAQPPPADTPRVVAIDVSPRELILRGPGIRHRLVATATLSDGQVRDVTALALFYASDSSVADVQEGVVTAGERGESFVACRFGEFTVGCQVLVLPEHDAYQPPPSENGNYIDQLIADKLERLRCLPADLCTDQEFLRRATIDITGRLPTEAELAAFLADQEPTRRQRAAEQLLAGHEFDDLWTAYWADILLVRPSLELEKKPVYLYFDWLRSQIAAGVPFNEMVRQLLTARGSTFRQPQTNFYAADQDKLKIAENVAQAFLGIRTQCAQCHNHPFDRWTMNDYYGFAAFFQPIARKRAEDYREWIVFRTTAEATHPVTGQVVPPKYLGGETPQDSKTDRLELVANWITDPANPYFAKNVANRVWALFFGRGIVEPVYDVRISNPPSNPQLYEAIAQRLRDYDFDVRKLALDIVTSHAYQRSTQHPDDAPIEAQFGRATFRRIPATVLLDCISQVTEARDLYDGVPDGGRAVQAPVVEADYFLTTFGQSSRLSVCACERKSDPTLSQALHLLNGNTTNDKIRAGKVVERMLADGKSSQDIIGSLYRRCLSRAPTDDELASLQVLVTRAASPQEGLEDVLWALLNSREFLFNR